MPRSPEARRVTRLVRAGVWLVRILGRTWRIRVSHDDAVRRMRAEGRPIVFTLWHGELLPLLYQHRHERATVMISEHADGEIIARIAERLGYRTVRGSTSRGAARAILEAARVVEQGGDLAITPDGPRGPSHSIAPGAVIVAHRTGAPIIAAAARARGAWHLRSWDRFMIPRPFARVSIAYSDACHITASDARAASAQTGELGLLLAAAADRAERAHG